MSYAEQTFRPHLRLGLLQLLETQPGYQANDTLLIDAVRAIGLNASSDQVRTELGWLAEQGLVQTEKLGRLTVAVATERGVEVSRGQVRVDGVKRPGP